MKYLFILPTLALFVACASKKTPLAVTTTPSVATVPKTSDYERVSAKFPDYTQSQFMEGKKLYTQHCGTCHILKNPVYGTEDSWRKVVPPMVAKVNKRDGNIIDLAEEESILRYVLAINAVGSEK